MKIKSGLIVALAAGSIAGIAQANELNPTTLTPDGAKAPKGYVYSNGLTGERVISYTSAGSVAVRGAGWAWDSSYADPCFPESVGGVDDQVFWVSGLHDQDLGSDGVASPDDVAAWQDWVEHPGDSIVNLISFGMFTRVLDPEEDGEIGHEMILVMTENDRAPERSGAVASTVLTFTELPGADDEDGSGDISFTEGNLWIFVFDLAGADIPFDMEIGDTNGTYDGAFPDDGLFGVPGSDIDGDGLIDSGYVMGWRQPGVDEGNQMSDRFPELVGVIDDNGAADPGTFGNLADMGPALVHPSGLAGVEGEADCYDVLNTAGEWPRVAGCDDTAPFPLGSFDAFGLIDALGTDVGAFWFGGFTCAPTTPPPSPPYNQPWANAMIAFNVDLVSDTNPCPCDINGDGLLDLQDISGPNGFIVAFQAGDLAADMDGNGILDLNDISGPNGFIVCFLAGCP